ncbi:uncharacterized protein LOC8274534 [Ricinus communis]|uniref:Uncharacterized protein n=1 Tax=Ricinus communis TaxID=3988 RepID=B9RQR3_RICCO|nr:uncharacterized protein LOC8274534 [Ricinus communis]EEF46502.1 conserved hypothetical protein [Ricinus communis]|eukprot:XP_002516082.1 uncharacterized protein LOC8274534 [Ricinus communis]
MASNARQERRRRIVERGSDRLALITGQIQNLNESPSSTPTYQQRHHAHTESSPSIMYSPYDHSQINAEGLDGASVAKLTKLRTINGIPESKNFDSPKKPESRFRNNATSPEKIRPQVFDTKTEIQESVIVATNSPLVPNESNHHYRFFSSKRINACIISSERRRAMCSLIVAFLVVISHIGYPLFSANIVRSESVIASRPLYIILLTDVAIVLGHMFHESGNNGSEEAEAERMEPNKEDGDNWDGAVKLLERGLVLYQAIRGIFIDCSVYLVVVISGLSLL